MHDNRDWRLAWILANVLFNVANIELHKMQENKQNTIVMFLQKEQTGKNVDSCCSPFDGFTHFDQKLN